MSNFRNVLKVFTMMRDFEPDDHALLNTLRGVTEAEREMLVEALGPVKRATAKRARKASKSPRAASLAGAIATRPKRTPDMPEAICTFQYHDESFCDQGESNLVHDKTAGYAGYHPFTPAAAQAASGGD